MVPRVLVRGVVLNLEYEGLHTICFHCGVYGHRENECSLKRKLLGVSVADGGMSDEGSKSNGVVQQSGEAENVTVEHNQVAIVSTCEEGVGQRVGEEAPRKEDMYLGEEGKTRFGPWIVVSKTNRKKKKVMAKDGTQ